MSDYTGRHRAAPTPAAPPVLRAASTLPYYERSDACRRGRCGALLNSDSECSRPDGHMAAGEVHRAYDPYGRGTWIEFDDDANITGQDPRLDT